MPRERRTPYLLFVLREKIIALLRGGESRVSLLVGFGRSKDAQTLGISNYIPRIRVLRSSWNGHVSTKSSRAGPVYTGTSIITPLIRFLGKRADIRINISSLCHLNNKKTKKGKKRKAQSYLRFPPINLIHLVTRSCWEKKNKDQDSYGWQAS